MTNTTYIVAIHNATQTTHHFTPAAWLQTYQPTNEYTYMGVYTPPTQNQITNTSSTPAPVKKPCCGRRK